MHRRILWLGFHSLRLKSRDAPQKQFRHPSASSISPKPFTKPRYLCTLVSFCAEFVSQLGVDHSSGVHRIFDISIYNLSGVMNGVAQTSAREITSSYQARRSRRSSCCEAHASIRPENRNTFPYFRECFVEGSLCCLILK